MYYFLFILYLAIGCYFICRIPFIKKTELGSKTILLLFLLKIAAGVLLGYIMNSNYTNGNDYLQLNTQAIHEFNLLQTDPGLFFREIYQSNYNGNGYDNPFGSYRSFWNDLEYNLLAKTLAPLNFLSGGNYYINGLFFNCFGFLGHVALYHVFANVYKEKKGAVIAGTFLLPSLLLFSSSIGKDNVCFTLIAGFCCLLYFSAFSRFTIKRSVLLFTLFCGVLLMRNHIALLLIPAAVAFVISTRKKINPLKIFTIIYGLLFVLLLIVPRLSPTVNPAAVISQKQKDFLELGLANSQIPVNAIEPSAWGLLKNAPQAINHGFFRPYIWEARNIFTFLQALEVSFYLMLFTAFCIAAVQNRVALKPNAFVLFGIFFSFTVLLLNGYIVPNTNTLVRYRSIYLPFLLLPVICNLVVPNFIKRINF
ncbi:MAG: hypothetical protein H7Y86_12750 [Rhizobacter sp.]|nr:hypothetical protein [Ferruginibacter sp.]